MAVLKLMKVFTLQEGFTVIVSLGSFSTPGVCQVIAARFPVKAHLPCRFRRSTGVGKSNPFGLAQSYSSEFVLNPPPNSLRLVQVSTEVAQNLLLAGITAFALRTNRSIMDEDAVGTYMVYVFGLDLKVVDRFHAGTWHGRDEPCRAVEGAKTLANFQFVGTNKLLPVLAPERVVGRGADRLGKALHVEIENLGRGVAERAGDHAPRAGRDRRAGTDRKNRGVAVDAALGDGDRDLGADLSPLVLEPGDGPEENDVGPGAVSLWGTEFETPPSGWVRIRVTPLTP